MRQEISSRGAWVLAWLTITAMVLLINPWTTPFATYDQLEVSNLTYHEGNGGAYVEATVMREGSPFMDKWTLPLKQVKIKKKHDAATVMTKNTSEFILIKNLYISQSDYNTLTQKGELKY